MTHSPALDDYLLALLDSAPASGVEPAWATVDSPVLAQPQTVESAAPADAATDIDTGETGSIEVGEMDIAADAVVAETTAVELAAAVEINDIVEASAPTVAAAPAEIASATAAAASLLAGSTPAVSETEDGNPEMRSQTATAEPESQRPPHLLPDIRNKEAMARSEDRYDSTRQPAMPAFAPSPAAPRALSAGNAAPRYVAPAPLPLGHQHDRGHQHRRASERTTRWLRMRCDEQHYALELLKVQEVVRPGTLLPLRGSPLHMLGVMNLRCQVVPVLDLGIYLGRPAIVPNSATRIVVLEENGEVLGLRVTAVEDVTNLTDQQIEPPDNSRMCRLTSQLFRGVARLGGRAVVLLDASQLLK